MRLRTVLASVLAAVLAMFGLTLVVAPSASAGSLSFAPTGDTFVTSVSANAGTNFGTSPTMRANGSPEKIGLLRFEVTGIPTGATNVVPKLVLHASTSSPNQPSQVVRLRQLSGAWDPATVTYNTRPTVGSTTGAAATLAPGGTVEFAPSFSTNGVRNWAVTAAGTTDAVFASSEDPNPALRPQLVITYTDPNTAPTVSAGADQTVTLPSGASLDGTVNDDGQPGPATSSWSKVSGPGTVTFADPALVDTSATFSQPGTYVLRLSVSDGALNASDDVQVTVNPQPVPATPVAPACTGTGRSVVQPFPPGTVLDRQWRVSSPPNNTTYDLTGVTSTAYPAGSASPIALGNTTPPQNLCVQGGTVAGTTDDAQSWEFYHDTHNASCVRLVALGWVQANGLRCHDIEDGLKFLESANGTTNVNATTFYSAGTYLSRVRDDCIENDYTLGGVLYDSLWESCNTGISERPSSSNGSWTSPAGETVFVDHMLIGLWDTWHEADGKLGSNAIFKWSSSANKVVIRCSTFFVPSMSLNGADAMAIPAGTLVDDSACPDHPTTIVWTGGGDYPGDLRGLPIRVTSDRAVWDTAVSDWKAAHPGVSTERAAVPVTYGVTGTGNPRTDDCTATVAAGGDVNASISAAAAGAIICVAPADYSSTSVTVNKAITLRANGSVKIKNAVVSGGATLDGFNIVGASSGSPASGVLFSGDNNRIVNNLIDGHGLTRGVYCTSCGSGTVIGHNTITKVSNYGIQTANGTGIVIEWNNIFDLYDDVEGTLDVDAMRPFGTSHIVRNNYMHDLNSQRSILGPDNDRPHLDCIQHYQSTGGTSISVNLLIENNYCLRTTGMFIISKNNNTTSPDMRDMTIRGNVAETYGTQVVILSGIPNATVENNAFFGGSSTGPVLTVEHGDNGAQMTNARLQNNVLVRGKSANPAIGNKTGDAPASGIITVNQDNVDWIDTALVDRDAAWAQPDPQPMNDPIVASDFTLYRDWSQRGVPLVNEGSPLLSSGYVADVAAAARIQGSAVDIGAYELG